MTVSTTEYEKAKIAFLHKHRDWEVSTSLMDEYGCYHKTYSCADGAQWFEVNGPVYERVRIPVEVKGVTVQIEQDVKLFQTEGWSTDEANSLFCYEKF